MPTVKSSLHEHELHFVPNPYAARSLEWKCDSCGHQEGSGRVYHCEPCGFDLCPACAATSSSGTLAAPAAPAVSAAPPASGDAFARLVLQQQFDGHFPLSSAVLQCLGKSQTAVEQAMPALLHGLADGAAVWATLLVLGLLQTRYAARQDEWLLLANKARGWVETRVADPDQRSALTTAAAAAL